MSRFNHDPRKNELNEARHGIGLTEARNLWKTTHVIIPARNVTGENRFAILGKMRGRIYIAIFTMRGETSRIISCHRADTKWEKIYEKYFR